MPTQMKPKNKTRPIVWVALGFAAAFFLVWYFAGSRSSERIFASVAHTPITLSDETQNLRAFSWRSIAVQPPYNGTLDVTLNVMDGNPLDVRLVDSSQMDVMKRTNDWRPIQGDVNFSAVKTTTYHRTAAIKQGRYYLVLRDTSLGILSQKATDVSVKVTLNP
jgi:hypothetical protein